MPNKTREPRTRRSVLRSGQVKWTLQVSEDVLEDFRDAAYWVQRLRDPRIPMRSLLEDAMVAHVRTLRRQINGGKPFELRPERPRPTPPPEPQSGRKKS